MSTQQFRTVRRYAIKMLKAPDDRDELVLLAWQESNRLGPRSSMPLLENFMKWRARENKRAMSHLSVRPSLGLPMGAPLPP